MVAAAEFIDLAKSSPPSAIYLASDDSEISFVESKSTSRKRKSFEDVEITENPPKKTVKIPRSRSRSKDKEPENVVKENRRERRRRQRERDASPTSRSSRSPERLPSIDNSDLFVFDAAPIPVHGTLLAKESVSNIIATDILLPNHVSVIGSGAIPVEIRSPSNSDNGENEDDFIDYIDYDDDRKAGLVRYFDDNTVESKPTKFVCKYCGAEGDHKTRECPVLICLTCGARDEHSTRSCPISKTCYNCGMRGHINKTCPNRYSQNGALSQDECDRCGSRSHYTNECPTLWRIYAFVSDPERDSILRAREEKKDIPLREGGEGYIAPDDWCYNCGECGHLGDDCTVIPHQPDMPREPSAFSEYNIRSGPFFDPTAESSSKRRSHSSKKSRDWEVDSKSLPLEVGKQGRKKERARMEKIASEQIEEDDWFENQRNVRNRGMQPPSVGPKGKRKVELSIVGAAKRFGDGGQQNEQTQTSAPGLLARLSDRLEPRRSYSNDHGKNDRDRRRRDYHSNGRDNRGSRDRYRSRDGPRYNGGYS